MKLLLQLTNYEFNKMEYIPYTEGKNHIVSILMIVYLNFRVVMGSNIFRFFFI